MVITPPSRDRLPILNSFGHYQECSENLLKSSGASLFLAENNQEARVEHLGATFPKPHHCTFGADLERNRFVGLLSCSKTQFRYLKQHTRYGQFLKSPPKAGALGVGGGGPSFPVSPRRMGEVNDLPKVDQ